MAGQIGFDEGALFEVMAKPKRTKVSRKFDKDGNCIEEITTSLSYWDAVMIAGGPTLIFAMVSSIKLIGQKLGEWLEDDEVQFYLEHPLLVLGAGPGGAKVVWEAYKFTQGKDERVRKMLDTPTGKLMLAQVRENWGLGHDGAVSDKDWVTAEEAIEANWKADTGDRITQGEYAGYELRSFTQPDGTVTQHWYTPEGVATGAGMGNQPILVTALFQALKDQKALP